MRSDITIDTVMRRVVAAILALSATAFVAPNQPPAAPKPQQLVVLRSANDDSLFSSEKLGKADLVEEVYSRLQHVARLAVATWSDCADRLLERTPRLLDELRYPKPVGDSVRSIVRGGG